MNLNIWRYLLLLTMRNAHFCERLWVFVGMMLSLLQCWETSLKLSLVKCLLVVSHKNLFYTFFCVLWLIFFSHCFEFFTNDILHTVFKQSSKTSILISFFSDLPDDDIDTSKIPIKLPLTVPRLHMPSSIGDTARETSLISQSDRSSMAIDEVEMDDWVFKPDLIYF